MTNEQLTQEVLKLAEHQAKCDAEKENIYIIIDELKEDIKSTKSLVEDVHIIALQMKDMQKAQENTDKKLNEINNKVNELSSQEFFEYKENKKIIKENILNKIIGTITGIIIMYIALKLGLDKYI